nr:MAG TPA_asm: hypothetical protein [Caudoviricetes sp.]
MAYTPTIWKDGQAPALNAENLNKIEQGIAGAQQTADEAKQAVNNVIYDETLEKESGNYFYADFSSIDFTQYKNLKLFVSATPIPNSEVGDIRFHYEKNNVVGSNVALGSGLNNGVITKAHVNSFGIYSKQEIDMQYVKIIFGNQTHIGVSAFTRSDGFIFGDVLFGTGYSGTGPNFWGISLSYGASYSGTVRVTITGDKIS